MKKKYRVKGGCVVCLMCIYECPVGAISIKTDETTVIDEEKCKKCGLCLKIGCPAISKRDGKMIIDDTMCNGCGLCLNYCKFGAIEVKSR